MAHETCTVAANRSVNRVRQNAMKADAWIPLLFSMEDGGKRAEQKEG
jgi:hypothetical protein